MPSPYSGMDPYLEAHWGDIHHRIVGYACDALQEQLPGDLFARMEERICVESPDELIQRYPDIKVVEDLATGDFPADVKDAVAVAEPLVINFESDAVTEGFIEIKETNGSGRVITVIEVLSPANKSGGSGHLQYCRKQKEIIRGQVNLVEIDLLRAGNWTVMVPVDRLPQSKRTPYRICVWRQARPFAMEFFHSPLRERLPAIRIPLRATDADVVLDIQALIDRSYRFGRYERTDYTAEPTPPLNVEDAKWSDAVLREHGLRK